MKKKRRIIFIILLLIVIAVAALIIIKPWLKPNKQNEVKVINKIDDYGYILEDNQTSLHKGYFDDLIEVLKNDDVEEEAYAKLVVELFISDFYNLNNKVTKNNIGGLQYVYTPAKDNMVLKAKDTLYKYIESNINGKRNQVLPIVTDVKINSIEKMEFEYTNKTDEEAYEVEAEWTYKEDLGYQDKATFILIHEDKKLSIAELK
jgi:ABC-type Na+ efflux pump permease subunit